MLIQSQEDILFTILGIGLCLGGWLLFWLGSRMLGLTMGLGFGFAFGEVLNYLLKLDANAIMLVRLGCSLLGAVGGLLLMRAITNFLFVVMGFLFGAMIGRFGAELYLAQQELPFELNSTSTLVILGAALVMALLALWMQRFIVILITSYVGATFLAGGVEYFRNHLWSFPVLLAASVLWQAVILRRLKSSGRARRVEKTKQELKKSF